jgi:drug/metabolite transporter (DMT)-like permease
MRYLTILGVLLIAAGLFVIFRPPSYSSEQSVLKLGDLEAKVQQQRTVPGWVGGTLLGAGCVLLVFGIRKR